MNYKTTQSQNNKGILEVICGSMFSGKSEELIRRLKRADLARKNILVFKHSLDDRHTIDHVTAHSGSKIKAIPIEKPSMILDLVTDDIEVIGIDEIQFFDREVINVVCNLIERGIRVVIAGLDLDFKGLPFGSMPTLMAIADSVTKLKAICIYCGNDAHFTQRLVNGKPAKHNDPIIVVGAEEHYQARCRNCHIIDKSATF